MERFVIEFRPAGSNCWVGVGLHFATREDAETALAAFPRDDGRLEFRVHELRGWWLYRLDAWILDQVNRASQRVQRETGWDCFEQRRALHVLLGLAYLICIRHFVGSAWWLDGIGALVYLGFAARWLRAKVSRQDEQIRRGAGQGLRNPRRLAVPPFVRIFFAGMMLLLAGAPYLWLELRVANLSFALAFYLDACDPLPPCHGRIREWRDRRKLRLVPGYSHQGE